MVKRYLIINLYIVFNIFIYTIVIFITCFNLYTFNNLLKRSEKLLKNVKICSIETTDFNIDILTLQEDLKKKKKSYIFLNNINFCTICKIECNLNEIITNLKECNNNDVKSFVQKTNIIVNNVKDLTYNKLNLLS